MKTKIILFFIAYIIICFAVSYTRNLKEENSRLKSNQEILLSENKSITSQSQRYKISDSLNAIKVAELILTNNEYKRYRAEDAALIKKLKADKPEKVIKTATETQIEFITQIDTIYADSVKHFSYNDNWTKLEGLIYCDSVKLNIKNYEELMIVESIQKKRFWFIKLPIKLFGYKHKQIDVISKNPNTQILSTEFITFEQ